MIRRRIPPPAHVPRHTHPPRFIDETACSSFVRFYIHFPVWISQSTTARILAEDRFVVYRPDSLVSAHSRYNELSARIYINK